MSCPFDGGLSQPLLVVSGCIRSWYQKRSGDGSVEPSPDSSMTVTNLLRGSVSACHGQLDSTASATSWLLVPFDQSTIAVQNEP